MLQRMGEGKRKEGKRENQASTLYLCSFDLKGKAAQQYIRIGAYPDEHPISNYLLHVKIGHGYRLLLYTS